eukprot:TRINITY_DN15145_c1_g1_i5.p1 TRINITY_DN15145_c1_g1~~TRINITY_DN15145_c1_g1_i5.p1  ORF type:complete len:110 (-),score=24.93 TRINITY_DN15145_c1_g1_i5:25-354(-)
MSAKTSKAFSDFLPVSQALMRALCVITSGCSPLCLITVKTFKAFSGCLPFSHALMRALYVITSGCSPRCLITVKTSKAFSAWLPFSQALEDFQGLLCHLGLFACTDEGR